MSNANQTGIMPDLLVPLYKLPPVQERIDALRSEGIVIRRAYPFDLSRTRRFIIKHFSEGWADEAEAAFARLPITCWIAVHEKRVVGFACVEATARSFFGPTGVDTAFRGKGIGAALLLASLHGLREMGYAYGIIGAAGPVDFYVKSVGAIPIPDSSPGIYLDLLGPDGAEARG
ncbi:MAG: GNAT family N-acetyltransferase [Capsulimonadales bacterium]|nr:GNAT family N-acetyltransferase [Capsulimonadales bacterium]